MRRPADIDLVVEEIPNELHGSRQGPAQNPWLAVILPLLLSFGAGVALYRVAGPTLGLVLGGLGAVALFAGPIIGAEATWLGRVLAAAGSVHGITVVWLYAASKVEEDVDLGPWMASYLALLAMVFAIGGLATLLRRRRFGVVASGAVVTVLALAWLTWPIWLSPALHGRAGERAVNLLVPANPVFAVNGVLRERLGYWAEQSLAYRFTSLSDDVSYGVPESVLACVLLHGGIGVGCVALVLLIDWRKRREETRGQ